MNIKGKKKGILLLALLLVVLVCGGIYTAYRLHPENFVGKNDIITRGEFAAELAKELDLDTSKSDKDTPSFSEIDGHWAEKYIEALVDAGIIDPADYQDGFKPDEPITRAEIIKMIVRAKGQDEEAKNTQGHSGYDDQSDIADDDKGYVIVGKEDGIIGDTEDNKLHPNDPMTKGEANDLIDKTIPTPATPTPSPTSSATDSTAPTQSPTAPKDGQSTPTPTDPDKEQPTTTPSPTPTSTPTPGGSSGGGSCYVPDAQVRFDLPETAHTDTEIKVMPVWKYTLKEEVLNEAVMTAINSVVENRGDFVGAFRENVIQVIGSYSTKNVPTEYDEQITRLQGDMLALIEENAQKGSVTEDFDEQYQKIAEQIKGLNQKKLDIIREQKQATNFQQRVNDMDTCLKKVSCEVREFDNDLVRRLLQSIKVISEDTLEIQFKSGIVMKQRVSYYG